MPVLKDFGGFTIKMFFKDHNPPHVHVVSNGYLVSIAEASILRGEIDARFRDEALEWISQNRTRLMQKWAEYQE
jgi:hypothetical protein